MSGEVTMRVNDVELCVETFGDAADPAVLLVGTSMLTWDEEFCGRLAEGGRYVIRYDLRDTGQSVSGEPYSMQDLVADAVGLLDHFGLATAHVVGFSVGGWIAQRMALDHGDRVASLALIATRPTAPGPSDPDLPDHSPEIMDFVRNTPEPDWSDREAVIGYLVERDRRLAGTLPFDEESRRDRAACVVDRTADVRLSLTSLAFIDHGERWRERLGQITAPTLVLHGTEDPFFPYGNGVALAAEIPGAELVPLDGVGHELPREAWDIVIPALLRHTSGGWGGQANRLAARALAEGAPTAWFERLYAASTRGEVPTPWDRLTPQPLLAEWVRVRGITGAGRSALVVGCGLGADAEFLASLGFKTTAFDISPTAIELARSRFPGSPVTYRTADLLDPPAGWLGTYDLVVEIQTVQALPLDLRREATAAVSRLVAPGGTLLVIAAVRSASEDLPADPPWPLTRPEIDAFATGDLAPIRIDALPDRGIDRWRAEFHRPPV